MTRLLMSIECMCVSPWCAGLFDALQNRDLLQLQKAIEEAKQCGIEDDVREAEDVLSEEIRKVGERGVEVMF